MPVMISMRRAALAIPDGQPWAMDSGRYNAPAAYTDAKYLAYLEKFRWAVDRCLFATAPDVVGDAAATLEMSAPLYGPIRALGYPVALVAQDGLEQLAVPWERFDALFIGGFTAWKTSEAVRSLCAEARARGKWVHMGRVNSGRRLRIASDFGCDSVDGTFLKYGPDKNEPRLRRWYEQLHAQRSLWGVE